MFPPEKLAYDTLNTTIGPVVMAMASEGLRYVFFQNEEIDIPVIWQHQPDSLHSTKEQLTEYFLGRRTIFDIPLAPQGTPFQTLVWKTLCGIPYGQTICYKELALRIGNIKACRAVGGANGKNPIVIIQPCHRVITADGSLGGFSSGLDRKQFLLDLEENRL